ncbi:MAG TPA: hypothetical protein PK918_04310 [Methanotrichaceae archaeon]|nr:hypothetical protein [Methanotrichaceae archaeon]
MAQELRGGMNIRYCSPRNADGGIWFGDNISRDGSHDKHMQMTPEFGPGTIGLLIVDRRNRTLRLDLIAPDKQDRFDGLRKFKKAKD